MSEKSLKRFMKHRDKKERGQLTARKHLGLLEKAKDYKIRSRDYRKKRDRIRLLQQKAELRNPDEFSHEMEQKKVDENGNVVATNRNRRTLSTMKKHKEVDAKFLRGKIQAQRRELREQQQSLAALEHMDDVDRKHVIFVDDDKEFKEWNAADHFNTLPELVNRTHNRLTREQLNEDVILNKVTPGMLRKADQAKKEAYDKVREDEKLLREMKQAHDKTMLERHLMNGGRYTKIVKKNIFGEEIQSKTRYKWKSERKK